MNHNVYIKNTVDSYNYESFDPSKLYQELSSIKINIKSDKKVYEDFRSLLINMKLDEKNIGTTKWNPFSEFIHKDDKVVIKPNLVMHVNTVGTLESLITNFSLIRPVIDYTILALQGTGSIIVGDAPVQGCNFEKIKEINSLEENIKKYKNIYSSIELIDFRKNENPELEYITIKMDEKSSFSELNEMEKEYSITNYNLKLMNAHHNGTNHEYVIPRKIIEADVIINIPKPKTHRKAGVTACMKNFVGINGNKECLPHHRTGGPNKNGDEFPENSLLKNMHSYFFKYSYKKNKLLNTITLGLSLMLKVIGKGRFREGSWYGNDTIWRTILDLNKLILYTNKNGILTEKVQRKIFNVADMVISGEKEGPLLPSDKKVGLIVAGFNALNNDYVITQIMGFSPCKIKYIKNGYKLENLIISNSERFSTFDEEGEVLEIEKYNKHFKATDGWKDYLEESYGGGKI